MEGKENRQQITHLLKSKGNLVKVGIPVPGIQQHLLTMQSVLNPCLQPTVVTAWLIVIHITNKSMKTQL